MAPFDPVERDRRRLALAGEAIDYVLVRRRGRRGVALKVDENGLTVSAPLTLPVPKVEAAVRESESWVLRKVREWSARRVPEANWSEGASLPYLGGSLALRLACAGRARAERVGPELRVALPEAGEAAVARAVIAWYKGEAQGYLHERVHALAARARIEPPRFILSGAMGRWGSCNMRREVRLAWRLVKAPPAVIDYVVCHELAHLRHMNHSRAFWQEVERQCPDYRVLRAELQARDHLYRSF